MADPRLLVPDTSCLILFHQLEQLELLDRIVASLGTELVLLSPVLDELRKTPVEEVEKLVHEKRDVESYENLQYEYRLGKGEAAILKFGSDNRITAVIDDFKARKAAAGLGIEVTGTAGLLGSGYVMCPVKEKKELAELLQRSRDLGFYLPGLEPFLSSLEKKQVIS